MDSLPSELDVLLAAAEAGAISLRRDFARVSTLTVSEKAPLDFVSSADIASQRAIAEVLRNARPDYAILGEEESVSGNEDCPRFVVDPLDGTTNFLHGIPHFAISIALESAGKSIAGVVYDPIRNEIFWATRGGGCFVREGTALVSKSSQLSDAVVATGIPHRARGNHAAYLPVLAAVMNEVSGVRRFGSAALDLAYVAAGRFDAFFEYGLARWDLAAGILLVREAGGRVTEPSGGDDVLQTGNVLASNGYLHATLLSLMG